MTEEKKNADSLLHPIMTVVRFECRFLVPRQRIRLSCLPRGNEQHRGAVNKYSGRIEPANRNSVR